MRPNFFAYAYDERSQDAVICSLIESSATQANDAADQALRDLGRAFVESLLGKHGVTLHGEVQSADIYQQDNYIDVLVRIRDENTDHVLLIEDKIAPAPNGETLPMLCNRLQGYRERVSNGETQLGAVHKHWPVYLTTANQSLAKDRTIQRETGFEIFRRNDFLGILNGYQGTHPIVTDFRDHLQRLEDDFESYQAWRNGDDRSCWSWAGWEGFFRHLEEELEDQLEGEYRSEDGWGYVNNRGGGFLGFWRWLPESSFYLQLEVIPGNADRQKICFKVYRGESWQPATYFYERLVRTVGDLGLEELIQRPRRLGTGANLTFGWFNQWLAYNEDGTFDWNTIVYNWQKAWRIIGEVNRKYVEENC